MDKNQMIPAVETRGLSRIYAQAGQSVVALDSVTISFMPGCFASVSGPSGSGKTTLLNLIGGVDVPSSGDVLIAGKSLTGLGRKERAEIRLLHIGFIFQAYNLIPVLSAEENISFVMELQGRDQKTQRLRTSELLERFGMADLRKRRPSELSGGQQQRVAIARALAASPDIILADEPTANLDSKNAEAILSLMRELNTRDGVSFLFSTHDPRVLEFATRRVTLHDGKIESDETVSV